MDLRKYIRNILSEAIVKEKFNVAQNTLEISKPYNKIEKIKVAGRDVYVLFGDVDYYSNKEAILAIKRKSNELKLDIDAYNAFLKEFYKRFEIINTSRNAEVIVSIETSSPVTNEMANMLKIPFIQNGFKKKDPSIKMKDISLGDRSNVKDLFNLNFAPNNSKVICVLDDFITTGTTFKNAFDKLPPDVDAFGICLFRLKS